MLDLLFGWKETVVDLKTLNETIALNNEKDLEQHSIETS